MSPFYFKLTRIAGVAALLGASVPLSATTLRFDELPFQPVNGLKIWGVTFGFEVGGVASDDASYNALGPGTLTYLDDPVLEGDAAGILSMTFSERATDISFGLSLISFASVDPAALVSLYDDSNNLVFQYTVATEPLVSWTEGLAWSSFGPIRKAVVEFNSAEASRFAIDNLTYTLVPDAGSLWAVTSWASVLGLLAMRRLTRNSG
ncbi:MAG TPA: hypothetical protein PLX89_09485 [Verrucomicrobiota bacterium]|nr:hypothetical protein [Verrucomicrobiales bacterium]HRI13227.1 hypothetical protein [Verrucomicrobiota bacterium]